MDVFEVIGLLEHELRHLDEPSEAEHLLRASLALLYWDLDDDPQRALEWLPAAPEQPLLTELRHQLHLACGEGDEAAASLEGLGRGLLVPPPPSADEGAEPPGDVSSDTGPDHEGEEPRALTPSSTEPQEAALSGDSIDDVLSGEVLAELLESGEHPSPPPPPPDAAPSATIPRHQRLRAATLLARAAELRLFALDAPAAAAETALFALDELPEEAGALRPRLLQSAFLALCLAQDHEAAVTVVEEHLETPEALVRGAARIAWETLGEPSRGRTLLTRLPAPVEPDLLHLELALAAGAHKEQRERLRELADRAREATSPRGRAERGRLAHELARLLIDIGDVTEAAALLEEVSAAALTADSAPLLAAQVELLLRRDLALRQRDIEALGRIYGSFAELSDTEPLQAAYQIRAWELSPTASPPEPPLLHEAKATTEAPAEPGEALTTAPGTPVGPPRELDNTGELLRLSSAELHLLSQTGEHAMPSGEDLLLREPPAIPEDSAPPPPPASQPAPETPDEESTAGTTAEDDDGPVANQAPRYAFSREWRLAAARRHQELSAHYQRLAEEQRLQAPVFWVAAALLAETSGLTAEARPLWRAAEEHCEGPARGADLLRLLRGAGETQDLADAYRRLAGGADELTATLYDGLAAALQLAAGESRAADKASRGALLRHPDNLLALIILAAVQREAGQINELRETLQRLVGLGHAPDSRTGWLRELATLAESPEGAQQLLEQAQEIHPDDLATMVSLAAHYEHDERFAAAAELRAKIAARLPDREAQAAAYAQLGELHRQRLDDLPGAIKAYRAARSRKPDGEAVLRALADLHGEQDEHEELLEVLEQLLELEEAPEELAELHRRRARALDQLERRDEMLRSLAAALDHAPAETRTVELLARLCRRAQRWSAMEDLLASQPGSEAVLSARAEALEHLGEVEPLVEVRRELFEMAPSLPERADRAYDLGRVHEQGGDLELAAAWYHRATEAVAGHRPALGALGRIYRAAEDNERLVVVLEQELRWVEEPRERHDLLLDAATAYEELALRDNAIAHLEELLQGDPEHKAALERLERLYALDRPLDLARLLRHRSEVEGEHRAPRLFRAAGLFAAQDQLDDATEAYRDALFADMGDREVFTSAEAFLYERQRWREVMEIYDTLIAASEQGGLRAYRLADLYSRRGQVQLKQLGQPGEAAASFFSALEHDPKSESAIRVLTSIFAQQQDWLGLIHAYEFRAGLLPDNELFRLESLRQAARLASSRLAPGSAEARRLWEAISGLDPADDEALAALTAIYRDGQDLESLASTLEARVALEADEAQALEMRLELARLCEVGLDDADRAAQAYESVRALNEHHEEALAALARIYEATAKWEACIEVLNGLVMLEADPDERSLLYFKCGSIAEARFHDEEQAIGLYRRSLEESAGCLPALHGLRDIYLRQERWHDALETLESELDIWDGEREQAGVLARMGQVLLERLDAPAKAQRRFEQALKLDAECYPALVALFDLLYERGERGRALQLAERLVRRMSSEGAPDRRSRFYLRRGSLLRDEGDLSRAADSLVVALELSPANIEALDALIELCRRAPDVFDFAATFRRLEQLYRSAGNTTAVAHVLIAAATLAELAGDADTALELYRQAREQAPEDFEPLNAHVQLLIALRRYQEAIAELRAHAESPLPAANRASDASERQRRPEAGPEAPSSPSAPRRNRIAALLRLGEIFSEVLQRPQEAVDAYEAVLSIDMRHREGVFRLAQELYGLGRPQQARQLIEQLLDPELHPDLPKSERASYEHYLGAIQLRLGQSSAARKSFRRALQQDNLCVEAALALAQQQAQGGDRDAALELLTHSIHEIRSKRGAEAAWELRRALGALLLGRGDVNGAIREYESLLRDANQVEDRIMLAELFARRPGGLPRAIEELMAVLGQRTLAPQVFELLARLYEATSETDRVIQVLQVTELLGLARAEEKARLEELRLQHPFRARRGLDERARRTLVLGPDETPTVERMWQLIRPALTRIFPLGVSERRLAPLESADDESFIGAITDCLHLLGSTAQPLCASGLPAAVLPADGEEARLLVDLALKGHQPAEIRFAVGRALGLQLSGHGLIARLAFDDRQLVVELLGGLLRPPAQRSDLAEEFLRRVDEPARGRIDELSAHHEQQRGDGDGEDPLAWLGALERAAHAHGLLACDDIGVALRMIATLGGQNLAVGPSGEVAVSAVKDGPELVQYFLSERYTQLRRRVCG